MTFSQLGLPEELVVAIEKEGYERPYPIQLETIPAIIAGKDLLGIAKTGSGKTASFVLPILTNIRKRKALKNRHVNVLVVVPTRELAIQIETVFKLFSRSLPEKIKTLAVYGGVSINPQMIALQNVNVLIATPGRLIELLESKSVHLDQVETLVLDEADKLLNLGFKKEMDSIIRCLPTKRQNLLFSATLNEEVDNISQLILNEPIVIKIGVEENDIDAIIQKAFAVEEAKKGPLLRYLITENDWKQVLVFTSSVYKADNVADKLRKNGIEATAIHSKKSQLARNMALEKFKSGELKVLVATDLLSRGIDIIELPVVINYELPRSPKDYVHRIGRTGRADKSGEAISLISPDEEHHFKVIQKKMKKVVETLSIEGLI
jgi:ATP-dependent RNA helicase RhlE